MCLLNTVIKRIKQAHAGLNFKGVSKTETGNPFFSQINISNCVILNSRVLFENEKHFDETKLILINFLRRLTYFTVFLRL